MWILSFSSVHRELLDISVGAQSTLGGQDIFARNVCIKITKCPNCTWFLTEKLTKFPNFAWYFCPKNDRILHNNCPKNIFPDFFFGGGGHVPPNPPSPTPMLLDNLFRTNVAAVRWHTVSLSSLAAKDEKKYRHDPAGVENAGVDISGINDGAEHAFFFFPDGKKNHLALGNVSRHYAWRRSHF